MRGRNRGEMPTEIEKGTPSIREMAKESKESHTHSRSALGRRTGGYQKQHF
jgi:hypothetical protein